MLAKEKLKQFVLNNLEATKLCAKADFWRKVREACTIETCQQASHTIKTLTRDNLDTISDTRYIVAKTYYFYKNLYTAETTDTAAEQEMLDTYTVPTLPAKKHIMQW